MNFKKILQIHYFWKNYLRYRCNYYKAHIFIIFNFRLEDQKEDCQTKFGCRIEFMDLEIMKQIDKKVFKDLCQKIVDNCISEDDFNYFHLQDDSAKIQKTFFDL